MMVSDEDLLAWINADLSISVDSLGGEAFRSGRLLGEILVKLDTVECNHVDDVFHEVLDLDSEDAKELIDENFDFIALTLQELHVELLDGDIKAIASGDAAVLGGLLRQLHDLDIAAHSNASASASATTVGNASALPDDLLAWLTSEEGGSLPVSSLADLADGYLIGQLLLKLGCDEQTDEEEEFHRVPPGADEETRLDIIILNYEQIRTALASVIEISDDQFDACVDGEADAIVELLTALRNLPPGKTKRVSDKEDDIDEDWDGGATANPRQPRASTKVNLAEIHSRSSMVAGVNPSLSTAVGGAQSKPGPEVPSPTPSRLPPAPPSSPPAGVNAKASAGGGSSRWEAESHAETIVSNNEEGRWDKQSGTKDINRMVLACQFGRLDIVKKIYKEEMGSDRKRLNEMNDDATFTETPLVKATAFNRVDIVKWLLARNVDTSLVQISGCSPLFVSCWLADTTIMELLLDSGAAVDQPNYRGITPLMECAYKGKLEGLKLLHSRGANIEASNVDGVTPLIRSVFGGRDVGPDALECLKFLVDNGANLNARDNDGWDSLYLAKHSKLPNYLALLEPSIKGPDGQMIVNPTCIKKNGVPVVKDKGWPRYPIHRYFEDRRDKGGVDKDVDEMKIQTMFKMVDECRVIAQGKDVIKKCVYLTNSQASKFDEEMMGKFMKALEITDPKFVIKLIDSEGIASQMRLAHPEKLDSAESQFGNSTFNSSEINTADDRVVEQQILLFMKSVILPLAIQTRALIIVSGSNDCYLTAALARVALAERARYGKNCPFTIIATSCEFEVHAKAVSDKADDAKSIAQQVARGSPMWIKSAWMMNDFYSKKFLIRREKLSQCDLTEAAEFYIIFESYDPPAAVAPGHTAEQSEIAMGDRNNGPRKQFESTLLQYLTRKLPCVAITALKVTHGTPFIVDLVNRGIPVLMLDTTERAFTLQMHRASQDMQTALAKQADAFPLVSAKTAAIIRKGCVEGWKNGSLTLEARFTLLELANDMMERKLEQLELSEPPKIDTLLISRLAFYHAVINYGNTFSKKVSKRTVPLHEQVKELELIEKTNRNASSQGPPPEIVAEAMRFLYTRYTALKLRCEYKKAVYFVDHAPQNFLKWKGDAVGTRNRLLPAFTELEKDHRGTYSDYDLNQDEWVAQRELLVSSHVFSASVFDVDEAKSILGTVAKIDRLPSANTLEALRIMQDAWDHIEIYHSMADIYKTITKVCYLLLLLAAMGITYLALLQANTGFSARLFIVGIGFGTSIITSYVASVNPAVKWMSLRMAALSMESNIWVFRTRSGPYRVSEAEATNHEDDKLLASSIKEIKETVLQGADVKSTSFYSRIKSDNKHGQHPGGGSANFGALDNFAAPTKKTCLSSLSKNFALLAATLLPAGVAEKALYAEEKMRKAKAGAEAEAAKIAKTAKNAVADIETGASESMDQESEATGTAAAGLSGMFPSAARASIARGKRASLLATLSSGGKTVDPIPTSLDGSSNAKVDSTTNPMNRKEGNGGGDGDDAPMVPLTKVLKDLTDFKLLTANTQYEDDDDGEVKVVDSHYEPIQPDLFIRFRILPLIAFYKTRIPERTRFKSTSNALMIGGSIVVVLLGFLDWTAWAAAVTIVTSSITAYLEFAGTVSKISRYSTAVHSLQELTHWWQTLPQIDRAVVSNIDRLVLTCEEILQREQQAWKSTSQTVKMLQKASEAASSGGKAKEE